VVAGRWCSAVLLCSAAVQAGLGAEGGEGCGRHAFTLARAGRRPMALISCWSTANRYLCSVAGQQGHVCICIPREVALCAGLLCFRSCLWSTLVDRRSTHTHPAPASYRRMLGRGALSRRGVVNLTQQLLLYSSYGCYCYRCRWVCLDFAGRRQLSGQAPGDVGEVGWTSCGPAHTCDGPPC
jgi:hypothetical protein